MRSLPIIICLLLPGYLQVKAQSGTTQISDKTKQDAMVFTRIYLDVDTTVFVRNGKVNIYISDDPEGFLMAALPQNGFDEAKIMHAARAAKTMEIQDRGEFQEKGRRFSYYTGSKVLEGKKLYFESYLIEVDEQRTIILEGGIDYAFAKDYADVFRKAALSARIK